MAKDNSEEFRRLIHTQIGNKLERCAIVLKNEIKESISNPSPPRSAEGQPPHKETGALRRSFQHVVDRNALVARVGSPLKYALYLELGHRTRKGTGENPPRDPNSLFHVAARPYIVPAVNRLVQRLNEIMRND